MSFAKGNIFHLFREDACKYGIGKGWGDEATPIQKREKGRGHFFRKWSLSREERQVRGPPRKAGFSCALGRDSYDEGNTFFVGGKGR